MKHLHLSTHKNNDSTSKFLLLSTTAQDNNKKSLERSFIDEENLSINERLSFNFTDICPLFLLKEGIDHHFEFLDFVPDLCIRQRFHPLHHDGFIINNTDTPLSDQINSANSISTKFYSNKISQTINETTEIE